jgi:hypothetical protein
MKFLGLVLSILLVACSTYDNGLSSRGIPSGKQEEAINIARAEIARRHIRLPPGTRTSVIKDEIILEFMLEIPIYAVSFYAPDPRRSIPLYEVFVRRDTGKVYDFIDTHIIRR